MRNLGPYHWSLLGSNVPDEPVQRTLMMVPIVVQIRLFGFASLAYLDPRWATFRGFEPLFYILLRSR